MEDINIRIRQLRKAMKYSQEKFGEILGIGKSGVSEIENGRNRVTQQHINLLKNYKYKGTYVSEKWLVEGIEPIFKDTAMAELTSEISFGDDEFIKDFIEVYMELDQSSRDALKEIMNKMYQKKKEREG